MNCICREHKAECDCTCDETVAFTYNRGHRPSAFVRLLNIFVPGLGWLIELTEGKRK